MQERKSADRRASESVREISENTREAAGRVQETSSKAAAGFREYQLKVVIATQANINAMFEFVQDLLQAQSISEMAELSATHSRRQFEMMAEQTRELASAAQKLATQANLPLTSSFGKDFDQMS